MRSRLRTIAIIGGGFCGTVLAAALLRRPPLQPCRIVLIERREQVGRGVAYRRSRYRPLLNVPAGRMSADAGDPLQFARFAQPENPAGAARRIRSTSGRCCAPITGRQPRWVNCGFMRSNWRRRWRGSMPDGQPWR
jgi:cation diffusion facilitator CzcD-associated flavoprotein CzcO